MYVCMNICMYVFIEQGIFLSAIDKKSTLEVISIFKDVIISLMAAMRMCPSVLTGSVTDQGLLLLVSEVHHCHVSRIHTF